MTDTFVHVLRGDLTLGIAYLEYPNCIMWLQPEEFGHCFHWIDTDVSIQDQNKVKLLLEMKEVELGHNGTKDFPLIEYADLIKIIAPKHQSGYSS